MSSGDNKLVPAKSAKILKLALLASLLLGIGAVIYFTNPFNKASEPEFSGKEEWGPIAVSAQAARLADVPVYLNALGSVTPLRTVTVRSRIDGELLRVVFTEGATVKAGDLLAEIDPRPIQVQLMQAEGQLLKDEALLSNARIDWERYKTLLAQDSIAAQQTATQAALVKQYQGTVATDKAVLANAKLQLSYTKITAPISGRLGLRLVDQGNIVKASDTNGLVVITQVQPISVVFTLAEDNLPVLVQALKDKAQLPVEVYGRSGLSKLADGHLLAMDNQIDVSTGTLKLKAQFANDQENLFANQFVNVKLLIDTLHSAVLIPTAAVQTGQQGPFVYVVNADQTVSVRPVSLGAEYQGQQAILAGVNADELVVVDGVDKLKEDSKVKLPAGPSDPPNAPAQAPGRHKHAR